MEESKRILDIALEMETNIVTTHIGVVPTEEDHPRYRIMQDACGELARYADTLGAHFAVETGPEPASVLRRFLDGLHSSGVAVNLDPANLVMVNRDDPCGRRPYAEGIHRAYPRQGWPAAACLRPRSRLRRSPQRIPTASRTAAFIELPLGEGDVPFPAYLKALEDVGYRGFLTIEREVGDHPERDIASRRGFPEEPHRLRS